MLGGSSGKRFDKPPAEPECEDVGVIDEASGICEPAGDVELFRLVEDEGVATYRPVVACYDGALGDAVVVLSRE